MATISNEPFSLDEIKGILEIYEGLHGTDLGLLRFFQWIQGKELSEEALDFLTAIYKEKTK